MGLLKQLLDSLIQGHLAPVRLNFCPFLQGVPSLPVPILVSKSFSRRLNPNTGSKYPRSAGSQLQRRLCPQGMFYYRG
jgi:hypothetical protein